MLLLVAHLMAWGAPTGGDAPDAPLPVDAASDEAPSDDAPLDAPPAEAAPDDGAVAEAPGVLEIATTRRFGIGIALGFPPSVTAKAFFDRRNALAFHLGTTLGTSGLHLRLQYEQASRRLRTWPFGELHLGWQAGVVADFVFGQQASRTQVRPGLYVGPNVELRLDPAPVAAFAEVGPVVYPFDIAAREETPFFWLSFVLVVGGRWYF